MMKGFQDLPWWAKATFVFVLIVVGGFSYETLYDGFLVAQSGNNQASDSADLNQVEVTVLDRSTSQPIESVELQIVFEGPPVLKRTDRNGYVEIKIPARDSVQLTLTHGNYETATETINLRTDSNTTRILYLDSLNP